MSSRDCRVCQAREALRRSGRTVYQTGASAPSQSLPRLTHPTGSILLLALAFSLLSSLPAFCGLVSETFEQANRAYEEKKYTDAIQKYETIEQSGIHNGYVYYNLGNSYFMQGQPNFAAGELGLAILNYERARRLIPRYEDLKVNEKRALELIEDEEFRKFQEGRVPLVLRGLYDSFTLNGLLTTLAFLLILTAAVVEVRLFWSRPSFVTLANYFLSFVAIVVIILGFVLAFKFRNEVFCKAAIVIASEVDVRSAPGEDQAVVFSIHQGTEVQVHRKRENWIQVSLPNGYSGWLPGTDVKEVDWE